MSANENAGRVIGLDVGGANLKAADGAGRARSVAFALWRRPEELARVLAELLASWAAWDELAVTMTGELCDCFASKREGVLHILRSVERVTRGKPVRVWRTDGRLVSLAEAVADPLPAASANWLALATYAGRLAPRGRALLLDIGSTTTDIIGLRDGLPVPRGRTDPERLCSGELVYTGVRRTPVCALLGGQGGVAAEFFATMQDVYLVLGDGAESESRDTADGRPATRAAAHARLARMLCADEESSTQEERLALARAAAGKQVELIESALTRVGGEGGLEVVILAGEGEFLARRVLGQRAPGRVISLSAELGPEVSRAACAFAVAVLAGEADTADTAVAQEPGGRSQSPSAEVVPRACRPCSPASNTTPAPEKREATT